MVKYTKPELRKEQRRLREKVGLLLSERYKCQSTLGEHIEAWSVDTPRMGPVSVTMFLSAEVDASTLFSVYVRITCKRMTDEQRKVTLMDMWKRFRGNAWHDVNQFSGKWNVHASTMEAALEQFRFKMDWLHNDQA